jgi:hypothetical protein
MARYASRREARAETLNRRAARDAKRFGIIIGA